MESIHEAVTDELPVLYTSNSNYNYSQTTLPHLLIEYGLKAQEAAAQRNQKKDAQKENTRSKRKQIKTSGSFINVQDEKVLKRQTEKEEYYLKLVQDMYKLRDHYYKEYTRRLSQKVKRQQEEIKEKDIQSKEKREKKDQERKTNHELKKKLEHLTLETSSAATNIPKTDLYYIVGLEEKLLREGKLKTMTDYNMFRLMIQDPQVFFTNFKVQKSSDKYPGIDGSTNPSCSLQHTFSHGNNNSTGLALPWTAEKLSDSHLSSQKLQPLSQITDLRKLSRPDSWAITQQYPAQSKKRTSIPGFQMSKSKQEIHLDLDKRFPKVEMPKLRCFDMNLTNKPPDLDQVQQTAELRAKEKHRKRLMRQVAKMYQLAMSNVATSARILDQHEDMKMWFNGPDLCDVIADNHWVQTFKLKDSEGTNEMYGNNIFEELVEAIMDEDVPVGSVLITEQQEQVKEQTVKKQDKSDTSLPSITSRENSSISRSSESGEELCKSSAKSKISSRTKDKKLPLPLTMEEIRDKFNIVEAKSLSTFWMNYMGAGR